MEEICDKQELAVSEGNSEEFKGGRVALVEEKRSFILEAIRKQYRDWIEAKEIFALERTLHGEREGKRNE